MAVTTTTQTRVHPAQKQIGNSGGDIVRWLLSVENDNRRAAGALREKATVVYKGIKNAGKWPGGLDKILVAKRARRNIRKMAAAHDMSAAQAAQTRNRLVADIGSSNERAPKNGYDLTK